MKVVLDGGRLVNWLIDESFNTPDYRNVPAMIAELADGDPHPIAKEVVASLVGSGIGVIGYGQLRLRPAGELGAASSADADQLDGPAVCGIGHALTVASPCAQPVFASFLTTPSAPNTACVAKLRPPTFAPAPK